MNETFDKIFQVLNQGIAAINAAKQAETGSGTGVTSAGTPVQLTPEQRTAQARNKMLLWGGLAIGAVALIFFLRRRRS